MLQEHRLRISPQGVDEARIDLELGLQLDVDLD